MVVEKVRGSSPMPAQTTGVLTKVPHRELEAADISLPQERDTVMEDPSCCGS